MPGIYKFKKLASTNTHITVTGKIFSYLPQLSLNLTFYNIVEIYKILFKGHFVQILSKVGYGGLARRAPRFPEQIKILEEPTKSCNEIIHEPIFKQNKAPFNSSVPRKTGVADKKDVPG